MPRWRGPNRGPSDQVSSLTMEEPTRDEPYDPHEAFCLPLVGLLSRDLCPSSLAADGMSCLGGFARGEAWGGGLTAPGAGFRETNTMAGRGDPGPGGLS